MFLFDDSLNLSLNISPLYTIDDINDFIYSFLAFFKGVLIGIISYKSNLNSFNDISLFHIGFEFIFVSSKESDCASSISFISLISKSSIKSFDLFFFVEISEFFEVIISFK